MDLEEEEGVMSNAQKARLKKELKIKKKKMKYITS